MENNHKLWAFSILTLLRRFLSSSPGSVLCQFGYYVLRGRGYCADYRGFLALIRSVCDGIRCSIGEFSKLRLEGQNTF